MKIPEENYKKAHALQKQIERLEEQMTVLLDPLLVGLDDDLMTIEELKDSTSKLPMGFYKTELRAALRRRGGQNSGDSSEMLNMLTRLTEKVERANSIQHGGGKVLAEDWSELYQLTNEARDILIGMEGDKHE